MSSSFVCRSNARRVSFGVVLIGALLGAGPSVSAEDLKLPPEVTPALRAACETDVRRLCMSENPTVASVRSCVKRRFGELSMRCRAQIAVAGLTPAGR